MTLKRLPQDPARSSNELTTITFCKISAKPCQNSAKSFVFVCTILERSS